jgi:4-oxalocrotonate tautomerase
MPKDDRFEVISKHPAADLIVDGNDLGTKRTNDCAIMQVTLNRGRKAFQTAIADGCINI